MRIPTVLVFSASLMLASIVGAQQIKRVPIQPTSASDGKEMFAAYCAVCHGNAGKGDGPAATALKKRPADLTQLARRNNGTFPTLRVRYFIAGDETVAAHGTRDMPVWGKALRSLRPEDPAEGQMRIEILEHYVQTLQAQ